MIPSRLTVGQNRKSKRSWISTVKWRCGSAQSPVRAAILDPQRPELASFQRPCQLWEVPVGRIPSFKHASVSRRPSSTGLATSTLHEGVAVFSVLVNEEGMPDDLRCKLTAHAWDGTHRSIRTLLDEDTEGLNALQIAHDRDWLERLKEDFCTTRHEDAGNDDM